MKKIVLTQDYEFGIPLEIGKLQKIMWGGVELEVTSNETDKEIQIQINLEKYKKDFLHLNK